MSEKKSKAEDEKKPAPAANLADKRERPAELGELDLSVEEIEERISPSETNVFDK